MSIAFCTRCNREPKRKNSDKFPIFQHCPGFVFSYYFSVSLRLGGKTCQILLNLDRRVYEELFEFEIEKKSLID